MSFTSKIKNKFININTELKKLHGVSKDEANEIFSSIGEPEFNTISYKLGKTLIDAKKDLPNAISTPKKLVAIYLESKNRKSVSVSKESSEESFKQLSNPVAYKSIESFLYSANSTLIKSDFSTVNDFISTFGISSGERVSILSKDKVFFESDLDKPIYTSSKGFWQINKNTGNLLYLNFSFNISSDLDVVVLISFFDETAKERVSYNMLPINKGLNLEVPANAMYLTFGLRVIGEGVIRFKDIENNFKENKSYYEQGPNFDDGISIVVPSYKGEKTILDTLESIKNQKNIDFRLIEVIIVVNGEKDDTLKKVKLFAQDNPELKINSHYIETAGASNARNFAISKATKEYIVFCDDDDLLSEEYLSALYKIRDLDSIGFCSIYDMTDNKTLYKENSINSHLLQALNKNSDELKYFTSAITMIASKIIPTVKLKELVFDENLKSGEDVSYFTEYFVKYNPKLVMSDNKNAYYIRRLRDNSVSRQEVSFDFNVIQRLDVIKSLSLLKDKAIDKRGNDFIDSKIKAQCSFIVNYLQDNEDEYSNVHLEIIKRHIEGFPYRYLQDKLGYKSPESLIISYCHPPFVDTSAVVTAKRVFEFNQLCDVVCADMSKLRSINPELYKIDQHLIRDSYVLSTAASFGNWETINRFSASVVQILENKSYETVYSRSFWPASHFAAFEYKRNNPKTKWVAEFSDPVILNIEGETRYSNISKQWISRVISDFKLDSALINETNMYVWCELIVHLLADKVIFTCDNQKQLMVSEFPYQDIIQASKSVKTVRAHPTLPSKFYESYKNDYELDNNKVNFAYFGAFYTSRRLDDLIESLHEFHSRRDSFKDLKLPLVHVFTEQAEEARDMIQEEGLNDYFVINPYVGYLQFLSMSRSMDVLIVNDAKAKDVFGYNPYLPSKLSDYLGSNSRIWMFCEKGSSMDQMKSDYGYKSYIGQKEGNTLVNILRDFT